MGLLVLAFALGCMAPAGLHAQMASGRDRRNDSDLIDVGKRLFHIRPTSPGGGGRRPRAVYYSVLPVGSPPPGSGALFVTSTTAAFYVRGSEHSFLSTITFSPYVAMRGRIGFSFRSNLWLGDNRWDVLGDTRFLYYPQYTWGLGGNPGVNNFIVLDYKYVRFYQTLLRRIKPYLFAGVGYQLDDHFDIDTRGDSNYLRTFTHYPFGTGSSENSISSGLTFNLVYDARRNSENPLPGWYGQFAYRTNAAFLGSNAYWESIYADVRKYIPMPAATREVLSFWTYYWTVLGSHAPYLDLPGIGWDPYQQRSGRGFPQGRYRGRDLFYAEVENRRDITANGLVGCVVFANVNSVTEPFTRMFRYFHPAAGLGLRIKVNKRSNTNMALDFGVSRGYSALYLNLGETF